MSNLNSLSSDNGAKNHFVTFNQDISSLAAGSKKGFRIFSLNTVDELEQIYRNDTEDTCIVERLFSSSLVALVSLASPRKLKVCHFKKGTEICNYSYSNSILTVRLNRHRLVVCLEESLYVHNIRDMKVLHTIRDTPKNPKGLCALSPSSTNCLLAFPGSAINGEVSIFDAFNLQSKINIAAHDSPLAAIAFNQAGTRIATASEKGTVIRVFSTIDGTKLHEFRRGVKRCVDISDLSFSTCGKYLCASSNTETVHIFKLEETNCGDNNNGAGGAGSSSVASSASVGTDENNTAAGSWMGYFSSYLPTQVTEVFSQGRAFATAYLPKYGIRNVIALTSVQNQLRLMVATEEGMVFVYNLDPNEGGDLTLYKEFNLDEGGIATGGTSVAGVTTAAGGTLSANLTGIDGGSSAMLGSYAGIVKGNPMGKMSESEKLREIVAATESPPKHDIPLNDDQEYPPLTQITSD